jgi:hypothetical protein
MYGKSQMSWFSVSFWTKEEKLYALAGLIPQTSSLCPILTAAKNVSYQTFPAVEVYTL